MFYQLSQVDPLSAGGASVPGFPVGEDQRAQNFVAEDTHTFSPTLIAVARFSFLRNKFLYGERENHQPPSALDSNTSRVSQSPLDRHSSR